MIEKFADFEGTKYLEQEGEFIFTVDSCELKQSSTGNDMAVFTVKSLQGQSTLYFSLTPKARWKYNNFIKVCLYEQLNTPEKIAAFELDYQTIGRDLIGKQFIGRVIAEAYDKEVKVPQPDGTFMTEVERRTAYRINEFSSVEI